MKVLSWILNFIFSLFKTPSKVIENPDITPKPVESEPEVSGARDPFSTCPWLEVADKELGTKEVTGNGNNPRILEYHSATYLKAHTDSTAWCAAFACWVLHRAGYKSTISAWARDFLKYGEHLAFPARGCIMVFERNAPGGDSHVAFYTGIETIDGYQVLGGNQGDAVSLKVYPKKDLLGCRWPVKA